MALEGRMLSRAEARRFYDRFGARQDSQAFYERPALERMLANLALAEARAVVEFGCGTGRLAAELLAERLAPECRYLGLDLSHTMVELARARTAPFGERAEIRQTDGTPQIEAPAGSFDRFVTTYVLDLLPAAEIDALLAEAQRLLAPGGRLGVASLTRGRSGVARGVTWVWERIHAVRPAWVGGCRPIEVADLLSKRGWSLRHRSVVAPYAIASEVVVAERS
jgi:ubiquinone/menaquinone biosynthesis C-methylase UbiE